ncbi:hypothetical protein BDA99DRAFT_499617 [Phascolomyces articulosus]|uniref:F-box domain-containing protein n=1 Tax=Phascolomyces articulosus TaxID=60185 RepID=A0AAD5K829_9FUNG|nr:hypothetical protein BDA99DRAFT_499617 [Phascolomyces articulosus]
MSKRRTGPFSDDQNNKRRATISNGVCNFESFCPPSRHSVYSTPLKECIHNVEQRAFQTAIDSSTQIINHLFDDMLTALDTRAAAYGMNMQIDLGLRDAHRIMSCAPMVATGYLRAGQLYSLSSHYKKAILVYEQGIDTVSYDDSPLWTILLERYNEAKEKMNQRIDFFKTLPYDVMCLVIDWLPFDTIMEMLFVSRIWRDRIATCAKAWSNMQVSSASYHQLENAMMTLSHINQHIQKLELRQLLADQSDKLFVKMESGAYGALRSLKFFHCQMFDYRYCMNVLQKLHITLEELFFDTNDTEDMVIPLDTLLTTCTHLKRLHCQQANIILTADMFDNFPTTRVLIHSLIDMTLHFRTIDTSLLEQILYVCPKLLRLEVSHCDTTAVEIIRKTCQNLYSLGINTYADNLDKEESNTLLSPPPSSTAEPSAIGIRRLYMSLNREGIEPMLLLADHAHTIEKLRLRYRDLGDQESLRLGARPLNTFVYTRLTSLSLVYNSYRVNRVAACVLSRCPLLESLHLGFQEQMDGKLFQSIGRLENLKELSIRCAAFQMTCCDELGAMMRTFATRAKIGKTSLEKLILNECYGQFNEVFLEPLADIPTLRMVHFEDLDIDKTNFEKFTKALSSSTAASGSSSTSSQHRPSMLHSIVLSDLDCVSDESLRHISYIHSLRYLKLYRVVNITPVGIRYLKTNQNITFSIHPEF